MKLRVAVQMDPIESIDIAGDSTFAIMLEAQARGHERVAGASRGDPLRILGRS